MFALGEIAISITATVQEFDRLFLQAQVDTVIDPAERVSLQALADGKDRVGAIENCLQHAEDADWLDLLLDRIVKAGLEDGRVNKYLMEAVTDPAGLQAMTNLESGMGHPDLFHKRLADAVRWTVMVLVNGARSGTGVLVAPHLVLTAFHVVRPLFKRVGNEWQPRSGHGLEVEFDNCMMLAGQGAYPRRPVRVAAAEDWCARFSPAHQEELRNNLPKDIKELDGYWDYAVIKLAEAPGLERRWAELKDTSVVPAPSSRIVVMQHPDGAPMRFDEHEIAGVQASFNPAVPQIRFVHQANTRPGSSGGPCFDKQFALFGLHQGEWSFGTAAAADAKANRGIPLDQIAKHIRQLNGLPPLDPMQDPVLHLGPDHYWAPVIGCDDFQRDLAALTRQNSLARVIVIQGQGKSFRTEVLQRSLPDTMHLTLFLDAPTISRKSGAEIAALVCLAAGDDAPAFETADEFDSTQTAWVRSELWGKTADVLANRRTGRLVWVVLGDLNKCVIDGPLASDFLYAMYDAVRALPWLRIVLDGMQGDIPQALASQATVHFAKVPGKPEIEQQLNRRIAKAGMPSQLTTAFMAATIVRMMNQPPPASDRERLQRMARETQQQLKTYFEEASLPAEASHG